MELLEALYTTRAMRRVESGASAVDAVLVDRRDDWLMDTVSGSSGSLVSWEQLGREGRRASRPDRPTRGRRHPGTDTLGCMAWRICRGPSSNGPPSHTASCAAPQQPTRRPISNAATSSGATESTPPGPIGEYPQSALGRERILEYFSSRHGTPMTILRLNYAIDLRYGVLLDVGQKVFERRPVDLAMGHANVIWQGDANSVCLRSFALCQSPPEILNVTGPEIISIRWLAGRFGERFGIDPILEGTESDTALLNNAARCHRLFGYPELTPAATAAR